MEYSLELELYPHLIALLNFFDKQISIAFMKFSDSIIPKNLCSKNLGNCKKKLINTPKTIQIQIK